MLTLRFCSGKKKWSQNGIMPAFVEPTGAHEGQPYPNKPNH